MSLLDESKAELDVMAEVCAVLDRLESKQARLRVMEFLWDRYVEHPVRPKLDYDPVRLAQRAQELVRELDHVPTEEQRSALARTGLIDKSGKVRIGNDD